MKDKYDTWCLRAWRRRRTVSDWQASGQASRAALSIPESRLSARANASAPGQSRCPNLPPTCLSFLLKFIGTGTTTGYHDRPSGFSLQFPLLFTCSAHDKWISPKVLEHTTVHIHYQYRSTIIFFAVLVWTVWGPTAWFRAQ